MAGGERGREQRDDGRLWDITCRAAAGGLPGVRMAGFADRGVTPPGLRLIPHPALTLIFVFDGSIAVSDPSGRSYRGSFAIGPGYGQALHALQVDAFCCLQVRLSPLLARGLLGGAVEDLDSIVSVEELLGSAVARRLGDQLSDRRSWPERFAVIDDWLAERRRQAAPVADEVGWAWRRITSSRGTVRIEQLAGELGWSRKRLWSRFSSGSGLTPKQAAKLVRFDHAVHRLVAGQSPASVAADGGYADQAHLHRDVTAFTGLTPITVTDEPFLAVDDVAWGWPSRLTPRS